MLLPCDSWAVSVKTTSNSSAPPRGADIQCSRRLKGEQVSSSSAHPKGSSPKPFHNVDLLGSHSVPLSLIDNNSRSNVPNPTIILTLNLCPPPSHPAVETELYRQTHCFLGICFGSESWGPEVSDTGYNAYSIEVTTHGPCEDGRYRAISAQWMLGPDGNTYGGITSNSRKVSKCP